MLVFRPHEKNLFGETRSWSAEAAGGLYIITRGAGGVTGEQYQAVFQAAGMRPELLNGGAWRPSYELTKKMCEQDATTRARARFAAKTRRPGR
jgi:hypothetical protein